MRTRATIQVRTLGWVMLASAIVALILTLLTGCCHPHMDAPEAGSGAAKWTVWQKMIAAKEGRVLE